MKPKNDPARMLADLLRGGVGPGLPRKISRRKLLLRAVADRLDSGRAYTEQDLTRALRDWLEMAGPQVCLDPVTLRRALVDHGWLLRDDAGSVYRLGNGEGGSPG